MKKLDTNYILFVFSSFSYKTRGSATGITRCILSLISFPCNRVRVRVRLPVPVPETGVS